MRGSRWPGFEPLDAAAFEHQERAVVVLHDLALLGEIGGVLLGIAPVVDENADQEAVRPPVGDVEGEIAADGGEAAGLHDIGENIGAHLRRPIAQFAQAARRDIGGDRRRPGAKRRAPAARNGRTSRQGDTPAAFITMISESELSLLRTCAAAMTSAIGAIIMTSSGMIRPVMPMKTSSVWRWLVIRSNSRIACVNHITTVKLTRVIRNAPIVVRNMYRPIDPIGLNFPTGGPNGRPGSPTATQRRPSRVSPNAANFMLSQNGLAKAKPIELAQQRC